MKIRKMLSAFLGMAIVTTMLSAFTVAQAASEIQLSATAAYNEEEEAVELTISYSGFDDAVAYTMKKGKVNVNGIKVLGFEITNDAGLPVGWSYTSKDSGCAGIGTVSEAGIYAYLATSFDGYYGQDSGVLCKVYYETDPSTPITFTVTPLAEGACQTGKVVNSEFKGNEEPKLLGATYDFNKSTPPAEEVKAAFDKDAATKYEYETVYNYGVGGTVTVPAGKSTTGVTFDISNGTDTFNYDFDFGTSIAANTSFGLNIGNVPKDVTLTFSNLKVK